MATTHALSVEERIERWFAQVLYTGDDKHGDLHRIALFHIGKRLDEIWGEEYEEGTSPADYTRLVLLEAESDAESMGGLQKYSLQAFHGKRKTATRKMRFRLAGGEDLEAEGEMTEAGATGLVKQSHRHIEATMKVALGTVEAMMRRQERAIARAEARAEKAEDRHFEMLKLQEDLLSLRQERELEMLKAQNMEKRIDEGLETVKLLAPAVVNRISGKQLLPENASPGEQSLNAFIESLEPEQMEKLATANILKPPQMIAIMELINSRLDKDKAAE